MGIISDAAQPPGDIMRRLRDIERRLDELACARRLESSTVGKGGMKVKGGTLEVVNADTTSTVYFGPLVADGERSRGWIFSRDNGEPAFTLQGQSGRQIWALWDNKGNIIASNDAESGEGLARPWIPLSIPQPTGSASWPATTSGDWATIAQSFPTLQHPRIDAIISTTADDGVTGDVRLAIDGDPIGPTATAGKLLQFSAPVPKYEWNRLVSCELQARRTSGDGHVRATVKRLYGTQS